MHATRVLLKNDLLNRLWFVIDSEQQDSIRIQLVPICIAISASVPAETRVRVQRTLLVVCLFDCLLFLFLM